MNRDLQKLLQEKWFLVAADFIASYRRVLDPATAARARQSVERMLAVK